MIINQLNWRSAEASLLMAGEGLQKVSDSLVSLVSSSSSGMFSLLSSMTAPSMILEKSSSEMSLTVMGIYTRFPVDFIKLLSWRFLSSLSRRLS